MGVRVALVDDHQLFRERLRALLERDPGVAIVAVTGSGHELLEIAATTAIDVVCMDIRLPAMSGIETTRRLLALKPDIRVIGLSAYAEPHYVEGMLGAGAVGHFTKGDAGTDLLQAIHTATAARPQFGAHIVAHGGAVPTAAPGTRSTPADERTAGADAAPLGPREVEVLRLIGEGLDSTQIARSLSIEPTMVEVYRRNIMRKLNPKNSR
jgi:DNA-binding NarL/FixJ family response regulator